MATMQQIPSQMAQNESSNAGGAQTPSATQQPQGEASSPNQTPSNVGGGLEFSPELSALLKLQEEMDRKRTEAANQINAEIQRLTEATNAKLAQLKALLERVAPGSSPTPTGNVPTVGESSSKYNGQKYCPYCQIPGHDGRAHRGQTTPHKFNRTELGVFGLIPPQGLPSTYDTQSAVTAH